jgi:hypothetical protein
MNFNKKIDILEKKDFFIFKIDNFLEKELYIDIKNNFPKFDENVHTFDSFKRCSFSYDKLDYENDHQKETINKFNDFIQSKDFFNFFLQKLFFKAAVSQNNFLRMMKYLRYPIKDNRFVSFTDHLFSKIDVQYVFSFIKNTGGINPHVDAQRKYLSLMLYFPEGEYDKDYGTTFWQSSIPNYSNTHVTKKNELDNFKSINKKILKTEFVPNCLYGFLRNDLSWHSVEPVDISENYIRKSININFIYKN